MRVLIQRVKKAKVVVEKKTVSSISQGMLLFLGIFVEDTKSLIKPFVEKILSLRLFQEEGKTNLSLEDIEGEILIVPQFTLYADCKKGRRPSFQKAAPPALAKELYEAFIKEVRKKIEVQEGSFQKEMEIELINEGPFTLFLDTKELFGK